MSGHRARRIAVIAAVVLPVAVAGFERLARSQDRPKTPSAAAFSSCREQEQVGDARACWTVWLQKFVSTGTEAEVAYALEHARGLKAPAPSSAPDPAQRPAPSPPPAPRPAPPTPAAALPQTIPANTFVSLYSSPPSLVDLDGRRIGLTPLERRALPPGRHSALFQHWVAAGGMLHARKSFTVAAGETVSIEMRPEEFHAGAEAPSQEGGPDGLGTDDPAHHEPGTGPNASATNATSPASTGTTGAPLSTDTTDSAATGAPGPA